MKTAIMCKSIQN